MSIGSHSQRPTLLLTRPTDQAEGFAKQLRESGFDGEIIRSPLLSIKATDAKPSFAGVSGVIFTSRSAVKCVAAQKLRAWCVGDRTALAARDAGWLTVSAGGDVETLFQHICDHAPSGPLLHLRGAHSRGELAQRLTQAGIPTSECILYDQELCRLNDQAIQALSGEAPVIVPLFSPRSAAHFISQGPYAAPIWAVSMSATVAESVASFAPAKHVKVPMPTADAMVNGINSLIDLA